MSIKHSHPYPSWSKSASHMGSVFWPKIRIPKSPTKLELRHKVVVLYLTKFFFWLLSKFELCATESKLLETKLCSSSEKKLSVELDHFTGNHRAKFKPVMNGEGKRGCFEIKPLYSLSSNRTEIEHYPPLHYENMCNALCVHVLTGLYNHYLPKYTCI